jgi:hypothetical protein
METQKMSNRALTMLNESGDQTIVWDEASDAQMEEIIRKKMDAGIIFFIIEPRFFGLLPSKKTELKDATEAKKHRALAIRDQDLSKFVSDAPGADMVKTPEGSVKTVRKSKDASEVAKSESVAVKPMKGG